MLLEVQNLKKSYWDGAHEIKAVDGVSFEIHRGQTFGLVGESGCGKTTLARVLLNLTPKTSGDWFYDGKNLGTANRKAWKDYRRKMQIVFQDPLSSLDPRYNVSQLIEEPLVIHSLKPSKKERRIRVEELLESVGLSREHLPSYPHQLSGGQRQRVGIARALAVEPEFLICDEPVSALDLSIQAQILNLFLELQDRFKLTYLFISHDLRVIRLISDVVAVMQFGKIVECGEASEVFQSPKNAYTKTLLSHLPKIG